MKLSAGLVVYRKKMNRVEVLLVHPGGPFWEKKDTGVWSIPKGEYLENENALEVAKRELEEETGNCILEGKFIELKPVTLKSNKRIRAWAVEADFEKPYVSSNEFEIEWPPKSGKVQRFIEVDKAEWFGISTAKEKILAGQLPFLNELEELIKVNS